jgi:enoyl-CoA hydratase
MADSDLLVMQDGGLLTLTVNRPGKFNPLSRPVLAALRAELESVGGRDDVRCVAITGAGDRYFAAGGDLRDLADVRTEAQTQAMVEACRGALDAVRNCPVPVVAVLNGDAIGGGAELAVACDFRLMRDGAHIGFIHARLGITAAWGGSADLYGLVNRARALRMTLRAERVPAAVALDWGLADEVYEASEGADPRAALARFVAPMLQHSRVVLHALKAQAIASREAAGYAARREIELAGLVRTWVHPDHWAAVDRVLSPPEEPR